MFRGNGGANGGPSGGGSSSSNGPSPPSSATSAVMSFARALGMGKSSHPPAAPPPADLPNPQAPNHAADTNAVFYVDDTLSELARVRRYSLSQLPLQRLVYVKRIAACARTVGLRETLIQLLPLFQKLIMDQEAVVRTAAAAELSNVAHFLADPNQPWIPTQPSNAPTNGTLHPSTKPPTTAQSPDLTLEDDLLIDFECNDVDNTLPLIPTTSASALAAAAALAAAQSQSDPLGVSSSLSSSTAHNPDAMEVDSVATPSPPKQPTLADSDSDPMDVSSEADIVTELTDSTTSAAATVEEKSPSIEQKQHEEQKVQTPSVPTPTPASSSPTLTSTASSPTAAPSSPLHISASPTPAPSSNSLPFSPLNDPTSTIRMESYDQIRDTIIPCLQTLILDNNAEVRAAACDSLVRVADVLRGDDVGKVVLTLVLNLAHDERDEQRTTAVHLMHELAPRLGHDLCRSFVALELAAFADDSTFRVRKATAQSFGNVCEMVGEAFTVSKLLPCYVRLSKDLIWGVRKGCVESLVAVTRVVGIQTRTEVIIPMFERFAKDSSRWVRNGAYEILGPFLHALGPTLVSKELITYFANIPSMSSAIVDQEVNYHAAFNLPAVLQTIGRERWDELSPCFNALVKDQKFPVRRTLAYSLHELAALLGPQITEQALLPALDTFLRDLDEVRYGILKNFSYLLHCMTPPKRVTYLEVLWMVQKQNENWRWRLLFAKQLGVFAKLFSAEFTVTDIMPLTFALCRDNVAAVRRAAAKAIGRLLVRFLSFATPNSVVGPLITDIQAFASSVTFMERQLYLRMLEGFIGLIPIDLFEEFLVRALPLAADKTSNVRLSCVSTLKVLMAYPQVHASITVQKMVQLLTNDSHKEVKRQMIEAIQLNATNTAATSALTQTLSTLAIATSSPTLTSSTSTSSSNNSQLLDDDDLADILAGPSSSSTATATAGPSSISSAPSSPLVSSSSHPPPISPHLQALVKPHLNGTSDDMAIVTQLTPELLLPPSELEPTLIAAASSLSPEPTEIIPTDS